MAEKGKRSLIRMRSFASSLAALGQFRLRLADALPPERAIVSEPLETLASYVVSGPQIWPGSSGSGSRTGTSGFSGGSMGSLTGGGAGSAGVLKNTGLGAVISDCMTLRCQTSERRKVPLSFYASHLT
jgi:hypothetical protein